MCIMGDMDGFTLNLLTNSEVISIDQDPLASPAHKILTEQGQIWYKKLYDGSYAVGFFNMNPYFVLWNQEDALKIQEKQYSFTLALDALGIKGKVMIRDLWRQKDLGIFVSSFHTSVPYHDSIGHKTWNVFQVVSINRSYWVGCCRDKYCCLIRVVLLNVSSCFVYDIYIGRES